LFPGRDVHERANETHRPSEAIAGDVRSFEHIEIRAVQMAEAVFTGPVTVIRGESIADAGGSARPILGMNLFLPKTDFVGGSGMNVTEKRFEALRPGKCAGGYSPNPNSIIRSLGSERKMFRDLSRAAR
jgi:hypothetical protein